MATGPRDVDATPIAWREAGRADGEVVVFLHGLGGSRLAWEPQLAGLSATRRCVAWDMPGYGASEAAPGALTFAALADGVVRLLDTIGRERADLVGLSLGGMIALHTALRHPGRIHRLALLATSPAFGFDGVTTAESWLAQRLAPLADGVTPAAMAPAVLRAVAGEAASQAVIDEAAVAMSRIDATALAAACRCLVTHDLRGRLGDVRAPTLVIVGDDDTETPPAYAEALATGIPNARLERIASAGHLVNLERPDVVNGLLDAFLAGDAA